MTDEKKEEAKSSDMQKSETKSKAISKKDEPFWEPFDLLRDVEDSLEGVFNSLNYPRIWALRNPSVGRGYLRNYYNGVRAPLVDIKDEGDKYIVEAEMPGINKDSVEVAVDSNSVKLSGDKTAETEEEDEGYYRRERRYASFYRVVPLPDEIKVDEAKADFQDGILKLEMPKAKPKSREQTRKISLK
ncbi:MAG: Hsp20/alpha crystallin family protein [Candidatus Thermoplasmatota archaeon]|nr:Hsp20/alpha crystallin family protein [Candidatus Thermoplasmatota archaeon]